MGIEGGSYCCFHNTTMQIPLQGKYSLLVNVSKVEEAKKKGDKMVEGRGPLFLV